MKHTRIYNGSAGPEFTVYLCAMRGPEALKFTVNAEDSDKAVAAVFRAERNAPESAFRAVYRVDPTPAVSGKYGAPMGRVSGNLVVDDAQPYRARKVPLDSGGYDRGGAYWGLGVPIYYVEDGDGNGAFVRASDRAAAIRGVLEQ